MKSTKKQPDSRRNVRRVMSRLLAAIDRQIAAANDVRKARDEFIRVAEEEVAK